jgi:hypothetical protein
MLLTRRPWKLDHLFIAPSEWQRDHSSHVALQHFEVLDLWSASRVIDRVAREDGAFLRELAREVLHNFHTIKPPPGSHGEARENERRRDALKKQLGSPVSQVGRPPDFARLYVCKRTRDVPAAPPSSEPWKQVREAIASAESAPRGFVSVEVFSEQGQPLEHVRLEILLADGEVRTVSTNGAGQAHLEPIPQGECHIRVPQVDGSAWQPAAGPASQRVDDGRRRRHLVQQGECLSRIAAQHGVRDWQKVWMASENQALRKQRKSPHVLYPGDSVVVPGIVVHEIVRPTDATHRITVKAEAELELRIRLHDKRQKALSGLAYTVGFVHRGREVVRPGVSPTDDSGFVTERVLVGTDAVVIAFARPRLSFRLLVGALDPVCDEAPTRPIASGVDARLHGLGYDAGDGPQGLREALAWFQRDHLGRETADGILDDQTTLRLTEMYGV